MSRETQNVLLLLVGLATGLLLVKGTYVHYVKPSLLPWLIAAAVVLTALAVISIVRDIRRGAHPNIDGAHGHPHRAWIVWLLLAPVAVTAFVAPPPLGSHGATPKLAATDAPQRHPFPPLPPERAPVISLPEVLMRAATDSAGTLDGRLITITGFTMKGNDGPDLGRVVIICCAADAQLAKLHLAGPAVATAAGYPEDTWLRVEGQVISGSSNPSTSFVPTITVSDMTQIERPTNTYAH